MTAPQIPAELAGAIASRRCALLVGSGVTADSGGPTWPELVNDLRTEFNYASPLKDPFQVIGDIGRLRGDEAVYAAVQRRLRNVRPGLALRKLARLPWFATFTTNYDRALESALSESQSATVRVVETGQEFALSGLPTELLSVKLMGSVDIPHAAPGSMVLDAGDLTVAREQRSAVFGILATHAANLTFLFAGYSFNDGLFVEILERLHKALGEPRQAYYAVFREEPSEEKAYLLAQLGVRFVVTDLDAFADSLLQEVERRNPADRTRVQIAVGHDIVAVDATKVTAFLELHDPVTLGDMEESVPANAFFRGKTDSLKPFGQGWYFHRSEVDAVVSMAIDSEGRGGEMRPIAVEGNPGTGRRFVILGAVRKLIDEHRSLALRIPSQGVSPVPSPIHLAAFVGQVKDRCEESGVSPPSRFVLWAEYLPDTGILSQCKRLAQELDIPVVLIHESPHRPASAEDDDGAASTASVSTDGELSDEVKRSLASYLVSTARDHKFPPIESADATRIVDEEREFLPIIYRLLDPARRSIRAIVSESYASVSDPAERDCIALCAQATSVGLEIPFSVLRKALEDRLRRPIPYDEVFRLVEDHGHNLLKDSQDHRTNYYAAIYHTLIAEHLTQIIGEAERDRLLESVARTIELRSPVDADFASALLISNGVRRFEDAEFTPFSQSGLLRALEILRERQPARPVLHHLARLYKMQARDHPKVIPTLEEALHEPREEYALHERKGNVLTTLANERWERDRRRLSELNRSDREVQEILGLLDEARDDPNRRGAHAYTVYARILRDLWQNKDPEIRVSLINEALDVVEEGLTAGIEDPAQRVRLEALHISILAEINWDSAESAAAQLLARSGDGSGYFMLARVAAYKLDDHPRASNMLEQALSARSVPGGAIALKMELLLEDRSPNYDYLLRLALRLHSFSDFKQTWKSAFHIATAFTIADKAADAQRYFEISSRLSPLLQRRVSVFWDDPTTNRRKTLTGRVRRPPTFREGRVLPDQLTGWDEGIYFNPRVQAAAQNLRSGTLVEFELGFSPRGPQAFEVRPRSGRI